MRRFKMYGGGALLLVALLLVAVPASASAKTLLQFNEEEVPAASGAVAFTTFNIGQECAAKAEGVVVKNPEKKIVVTAPALGSEGYERCTKAGVSESGHVEESTWESSGKLKMKAAIQISYPGPCVYEFTKYTVPTITLPGYTFVKGETTGKLNKEKSSKTKGACEKKLTKQFSLNVQDIEEESFEAELT